jgi:hypothetical protein
MFNMNMEVYWKYSLWVMISYGIAYNLSCVCCDVKSIRFRYVVECNVFSICFSTLSIIILSYQVMQVLPWCLNSNMVQRDMCIKPC